MPMPPRRRPTNTKLSKLFTLPKGNRKLKKVEANAEEGKVKHMQLKSKLLQNRAHGWGTLTNIVLH